MRKLFLALVFLITLYSCKQSEELDITLGDTTVSLSFNVNDADGDPSVKSHSGFEADESTLKDIWVLQFNESNTLAMTPKYIESITSSEIDVELLKGNNQTIYLVANTCDPDLYADAETYSEAYTLDAFEASDFSTASAIDAKRIPMLGKVVGSISDGSGITENESPGGGTTELGHIILNRLFAKVTLRYTMQDTPYGNGLKVASIELKNVPKNAKITRKPYQIATLDDQAEDKLEPGKLQPYPAVTPGSVTDVTDKGGTLVFYMPQNFGGIGNNTGLSATSMGKDGANKDGATYMEIECTHTDYPDNKITYTTYLGGDIINNYNIYSNVTYDYNVTVGGLKESDRVDYDIPVVLTNAQANGSIASNTTLEGYLEALGSKGEVKIGIQHRSTPNFGTTPAGVTKDETGAFTEVFTDLAHNTKYTFRAFATYTESSTSTPVYGQEETFTTLPKVETATKPKVTGTSENVVAELGGTFDGTHGEVALVSKGVVYALTTNSQELPSGTDVPSTGNGITAKLANTTDVATFTVNAENLTEDADYTYKAFAQNSSGYTYGTPVDFKASLYAPPTVTTIAATGTATSQAVLNGSVTTNDQDNVAYGIEHKTGAGEFKKEKKGTINSSTTATPISHTLSITGNTKYEFRAYAVYTKAGDSESTLYGDTKDFTTLPVVTTTAIPVVDGLSATLEGNVPEGGNANTITVKGIVYSRSNTDPTLVGDDVTNIANASAGFGAISIETKALYFGVEHSYRAYATSAGVTAYGPVLTFTPKTTDEVYYSDGSTYSLPAVKIGNNSWAPVNCGYDASNPDGLFYQWGRKQGWKGNLGNDPTPIPSSSVTWNSKGETDGTAWGDASKTATDPCPDGWRVPTNDQNRTLSEVTGQITVSNTVEENGKLTISCLNSTQDLTLYAIGRLQTTGELAYGDNGHWSASADGVDYSTGLTFTSATFYTGQGYLTRSYGFSVRCVKE